MEAQNDALSKKVITEQDSNKIYKQNLSLAEDKIKSYETDIAKLHNEDKYSKTDISTLKSNITLFESKNKELQEAHKKECEARAKIQQEYEQTIKNLKLESGKLQEQIKEVKGFGYKTRRRKEKIRY